MSRIPYAVLSARTLLKSVTPLVGDCGRFCGAACCQGDDETGMLLFPGEQSLYEGSTFARVVNASYALAGARARLLICKGSCPREERPLACRLFPLFLRMEQDESTRVVMDPRAYDVCPLCKSGLAALDPAFRAAARKAYSVLLEDRQCSAFLRALSELLTL